MYSSRMPILFFSLLLASGVAYAADSGACYSIQDADARAYCLAKARKDTAACYTIQRADMRSMCLAEVRK